jgi:hypothetical protein
MELENETAGKSDKSGQLHFRLANPRSDFGDDDGGAAPMRMLAPPRTPMIRAYPPGIPLALRGAPPHLGRQS